jgi:hypothetical protein
MSYQLRGVNSCMLSPDDSALEPCALFDLQQAHKFSAQHACFRKKRGLRAGCKCPHRTSLAQVELVCVVI